METSVLIVEDESIVALDLKHRLTSLGFHLTGTAGSGAEAITIAKETRPDVILMDIQIKGDIDGIETAARIQRDLEIPSIFLTAYSDPASLERAKRSEAYGYLLKPFQERELLIAIELALYKFSTEQEVRANRALLDTTVNCVGEGIITTDSQRRVLLVNNAAQRLTGWSTETAVGRPLDDVLQLISAGQQGGAERFVLTNRDGTKTPVERTEQTLPAGPSGVASLVVVLRDISQSLRYEQSLVSAKEAAESAVRAKSDFLSRVTHELRTPLNSIIGMTELALEAGVPSDLQEHLSVVRSSADTLKALVSDILDYAKYETGQVKLKREIVTIDELVEKAARTAALEAHRKGLRLCTNIDPALPERFYGDEQRIRQTLGHLLSNAVKFTSAGYVRLSVTTVSPAREREERRTSAAGEIRETRVRFSVEDTGCGIPLEQQADIFDDFSQLDDPATRSAGGTGLGLSIVRRLIAVMNGEIRVDSTVGNGSVFTVDLPLTVADPLLVGERVQRHEAAGNGSGATQTRRIFTRDRLLRDGLTPWVTRAGSGVQVVELNPQAGFRPDDIVFLTSAEYRAFVNTWQENHGAGAPDISPIVVVVNTFLRDRSGTELDSFFRPIQLKEPLSTDDYAAIAAGRPDTLNNANAEVDESYRQHSVLIVDDDTVNLMVSKKMVERLGFSVHAINRAGAALDLLLETRFTVACIDIEMPGMDGWELATRIRAGEAGNAARAMPIVAITGHSRDEISDRTAAQGFIAVLSKPFTVDEVELTLRGAIAGAGAEESDSPDGLSIRQRTKTRADERRVEKARGGKPVAEIPDTGVSLPAVEIRSAIEQHDLHKAQEIVREARARNVSTAASEALFRIQLALRRNSEETAVQLLEELESLREA